MSTAQSETVARQPDISYTPDFNKYQTRIKQRLATEKLKSRPLPPGFPDKLHSDLVWEDDGLADRYNWTYELNAEEVEELEDALKHFKCKSPAQG